VFAEEALLLFGAEVVDFPSKPNEHVTLDGHGYFESRKSRLKVIPGRESGAQGQTSRRRRHSLKLFLNLVLKSHALTLSLRGLLRQVPPLPRRDSSQLTSDLEFAKRVVIPGSTAYARRIPSTG
jgi:hypothetical protein